MRLTILIHGQKNEKIVFNIGSVITLIFINHLLFSILNFMKLNGYMPY